jgi:CemA family
VQHHLQQTALHFQEEKQHEIRVGMVNIISDLTTLTVFFISLATRAEGRELLTNTIGRVSQGMSQTAKAFILILAADVLMGYHSEEGWTASLELLAEHYAIEAPVRARARLMLVLGLCAAHAALPDVCTVASFWAAQHAVGTLWQCLCCECLARSCCDTTGAYAAF